jgi:predicted RNA binding protein YcfA (HicA-like mRNA interferase family)
VAQFPRLKCRQLLSLLGYTVDRQRGSHRQLSAPGRKRVTLSCHDGADVPPGVTRKTLVDLAGLDENDAKAFVEGPMATVTVVYHFEDGLWWAESPDVPEFSGGGDTFNEPAPWRVRVWPSRSNMTSISMSGSTRPPEPRCDGK